MAATITILIDSKLQGGAIGQVSKDLTDMDKTARGSAGGFSVLAGAAASALGGIVVNAAGAAAGAVVGFVGDSISAASDFEAGMNLFSSAAGDSMAAAGMSTQDFADLFLSLGAKLPVSTAEVQDAAIALVKGGIDPAIIAAGGLEDSLNFAAAAGMGLEEAAELGVKMLAVFAPAGATAAEKTELLANAQNLLVKAAGASTTNVDELGNAMLTAAGQAQAIGLSTEEFTTAMGLLSNTMPSAAEAGTSFKNFLTRLAPSTKAATEKMIELGLATEDGQSLFFDAQGGFIGVAEASDLLKDKLSGLSDEERVRALSTIFGNDASAAAMALAKGGGDAYAAFAEQMAAANGVTEQAAAVNQGFGFAMENLKGTIEGVQIRLGTMLLPTLTQLTQIANTLINAIMGDQAAFDSLPGPIQAVLNGFTALRDAFMAVWTFVQPVIDAFTTFGAGALGEITNFVTTGKASFDSFNAIWEVVKAKAGEALTALVSYVQAQLPVWMAQLALWGQQAWQWLVDALPQIVAQLQAWGTQILTYVQAQLPVWMAQLALWGQQAWMWLQEAAPPLLSQLLTFAETIVQFVADNLPEWIATLLEWGIMAVKWLADAIPPLLSALGEFIGEIQAWAIGTALPAIIEYAAKFAVALVEWVATDLIPKIGPALLDFLSAVVDGLGKIVAGVADMALKIGQGIIDGIVQGISKGVDSIKQAAQDAAQSALDAAKNALGISSPSKAFATLGLQSAQGFALGVSSGAPQVQAAAAGMGGAALGATSSTINRNVSRVVNFSPVYNRATNSPTSDRTIAAALAGV